MFWTCAFSCQLSLLIANEPPFLLCGVVCSCLSYLEATRTYLSNCLITRISSFILGRSQALSSLHSAKPHLFCLSVAHCLVAVCLAVAEECVSTDAPLPVFSLEPGSGITVRKVGCRWFWGGFCSHFAVSPPRTLEHFCHAKRRREFAFISGQLCMLKAGGKFNAGYKRLRNAPVWCETKE